MTIRRRIGNGRDGPVYLPPIVMQATGLIIFVAAAVFWGVTGHQSVLVMSAALSLCALGAYSGIHVSVKQEIDESRRRRATDALKAADDAEAQGVIPFE